MNIVPASVYLADFSQEDIQDKVVINPTVPEIHEDMLDAVEIAPKQETNKKNCNIGFEEGGLSAVSVSEKLALQESHLRAEYQEIIEKLKIELAEQLAENVRQQFEQGLYRIKNNVSGAVLNAIKPFVDSSIKNKIMTDLIETIESVSHNLKTSEVLLSGSESKIQGIKTLLENMGFKVSCTVTEQNEITLEIDDMWIETRFKEWEEMLSGFSQAEAGE